MGNRAVITLDREPNSSSVGIYLHWNGGAESVLGFAEAARQLGVRSPQRDPAYCLARLTQIIGNYFGGTTSVGLGKLSDLDCESDNGTFAVSWDESGITMRNSENGKTGWISVDVDEVKKHDYWTAVKPNILEAILAKNKAIFAKEG